MLLLNFIVVYRKYSYSTLYRSTFLNAADKNNRHTANDESVRHLLVIGEEGKEREEREDWKLI